MASKNGFVRSNTSCLPPTMKVSVPPSAPRFGTGTGGIEKFDSQRIEFGGDTAALCGGDGAAIGDDEPFRCAFCQALSAQNNLTRHGGIADTEKSTVTVFGYLCGRGTEQSAG